MRIQTSPFIAAASLFALTLAGTQLLQGIGHYLDVSLVRLSLPLAAFASFALVYGYFFHPTRKHIFTVAAMALLLLVLSIASCQWYDFTADGMGYQQPGAEVVLGGWNPLHHDADMIWLNLYPSGAWELEAALASFYGSIEAAKTLYIWWLLIATPLLLGGLARHKQRPLTLPEHILALLAVASPVVLCQLPTHYVDGMLYLSGVSFIGALLHYGASPRQNQLSLLLMGGFVCFMVNAKLSGIYHAAALCAAAVLYCGMTVHRLPYRPAFSLLAAGLLATLFLGFHPYVTNLQTYGSLLHMDANTFTSFQRPANFADMNRAEKFFYSLFSATGGAPRAAAMLKWSWQILPVEWRASGTPDARTGGFGVLFALAFMASTGWIAVHLRRADRKLLALGGVLLLSSLLFPEGWWARYVPFAYLSIFLLLLALPAPTSPLGSVYSYMLIALFIANSAISATATLRWHYQQQVDFMALAETLKRDAGGKAYLVPPGDDYLIYNHGHRSLLRRLREQGVEAEVKVNAPCPHLAASLSEFSICYAHTR